MCHSLAAPCNLEKCTVAGDGGRRHAVLLQTCKLLCCLDCHRGEDVWARESHWWVLVRGARLRLSDPSGDLLIRRCLLGEPGWGCVSGVSDRGVFICVKFWLRIVRLMLFGFLRDVGLRGRLVDPTRSARSRGLGKGRPSCELSSQIWGPLRGLRCAGQYTRWSSRYAPGSASP